MKYKIAVLVLLAGISTVQAMDAGTNQIRQRTPRQSLTDPEDVGLVLSLNKERLNRQAFEQEISNLRRAKELIDAAHRRQQEQLAHLGQRQQEQPKLNDQEPGCLSFWAMVCLLIHAV